MKSLPSAIAALATIAALAGCHARRDASPSKVAVVAPAAGVVLHAPRAGLYTAGQPATAEWATIAARGVRTVVNLRTAEEMRGRDEAAEVRAAGMRYVAIPVAGADGIDEANARRLGEVLRAADGPVLVHCASGNRAGGLLALLAAREGMPTEQALALGRAAGMTGTEARVRAVLAVPAAPCGASAGAARCP